MKATTEQLVSALRVLSVEIQSEDGVANAVVAEAADRMTLLANLVAQHVKETKDDTEQMQIACETMVEATAKIQSLRARIKRLEEAGDAMAADDQCHPHLAEEWEKAKEATPSASRIVASVEEVIGGMGEDYAVVVLRSGHTLEVSGEGVVAWPSRAAQRRGDNSEVVGGISFGRKKEAKP